MSKMNVTEQVINEHVTDVICSIYNLENVLTQLAEEDSSLNSEFEELSKIVKYVSSLRQPMTDALHLYDGLEQ